MNAPVPTVRRQASRTVWDAWLPLILLPALVFGCWPREWPAWGLMWTLSVSIFAGVKWLTWRTADRDGVPFGRNLAYLVAWPGLNAAGFLHPSAVASLPPARDWAFALAKCVFGALALWMGVRMIPPQQEIVRGWIAMIGIVFLLHFGSFDLLSCVWRAAGIPAEPLMDWPVLTRGVSEFWSRRWNRAFRDLTHQFLFRPLTSRGGPALALWAGFLFSGLVHDLVITVPARGGYGGPTLFFLIQAVAIFVERSRLGRRMGLGRGVRGWLFAAVILLVPAPLLFPPPFLRNIILPFAEALGAF